MRALTVLRGALPGRIPRQFAEVMTRSITGLTWLHLLCVMAQVYAHLLCSVNLELCIRARIMGIVERDAIEAFQEAIKRLDSAETERDEALSEARAAARIARRKGYPISALAKISKRHRNTISGWLED